MLKKTNKKKTKRGTHLFTLVTYFNNNNKKNKKQQKKETKRKKAMYNDVSVALTPTHPCLQWSAGAPLESGGGSLDPSNPG